MLQVYGIPTCGTCKKAIQWLDQQGIAYEFINTKNFPPTEKQIQDWMDALGAKALRNTSGQSYRALGPERDTWTDAQWLQASSQDSMLLKRPVFVHTGLAVLVGFNHPEAVLKQKLKL